MQTDPIADMLNRVRTAVAVAQSSVDIPYSKFKKELAELLSREGYVGTVEETEVDGKKTLRVNLKYGPRRKPVINEIKRISKPGRRMYSKSVFLPVVRGGLGMAVISTSQGLMPDHEARRKRVGGEIVCEVW